MESSSDLLFFCIHPLHAQLASILLSSSLLRRWRCGHLAICFSEWFEFTMASRKVSEASIAFGAAGRFGTSCEQKAGA
jgi:hypothetical protein